MKGNLIISPFNEELDFIRTSVMLGDGFYDIVIKTSLEGSFEELISKPYDFDEVIDNIVDQFEYDGFKEDVSFLKQIKNNRLHFLKNAEDITFCYSPTKVAEFVKTNPILKTKRINFGASFDLDSKVVTEISEAFGDDTSNIYIKTFGNSDVITFKEYRDTVLTIENKINEIKKYNFSPLETIMYVYDMVRDKVYVEVDENEDKMISRDLSTALLGDKIVCLGYANVFKAIIEKLGEKCEIVFLVHPDGGSGHARICIFVKDEKYGVDGVYYFDPTWESRPGDLDISFLLSYAYFALTKTQMDKIDNGFLVETQFPYFSSDIVNELKTQVYKFGFEGLSEKMIKSVNYMSCFLTNSPLINEMALHSLAPATFKPNKEEVVEKLDKLVKYFDTPISADILVKVLYNVRKQQYYTNPEKYPFGVDEFFQIISNSGWLFDSHKIADLIFKIIGFTKKYENIKKNRFLRYAYETGLDKNIQQVKLAKTLRRVYEQKAKKNR